VRLDQKEKLDALEQMVYLESEEKLDLMETVDQLVTLENLDQWVFKEVMGRKVNADQEVTRGNLEVQDPVVKMVYLGLVELKDVMEKKELVDRMDRQVLKVPPVWKGVVVDVDHPVTEDARVPLAQLDAMDQKVPLANRDKLDAMEKTVHPVSQAKMVETETLEKMVSPVCKVLLDLKDHKAFVDHPVVLVCPVSLVLKGK